MAFGAWGLRLKVKGLGFGENGVWALGCRVFRIWRQGD